MRGIDTERIEQAIRDAERCTSGEIRVSIAPFFFWGDVRKAAELAFHRLGMDGTRDRNGVLFFLVPSRRKFTVLGDQGIHAKVGQEFWEAIAAAMSDRFHAGAMTDGLIAGIREVGERLRAHFPFDEAGDQDELPNAVDFGARRAR
jgi:uncharacterized membrane protein